MRKESQREWNKVADEMNAAMNELEAAYEKTKSHMKKWDAYLDAGAAGEIVYGDK